MLQSISRYTRFICLLEQSHANACLWSPFCFEAPFTTLSSFLFLTFFLLFLPLHFSTMPHHPIRLAVLLLWTTIACQGAVIPPQLSPQQELTDSPPILDHQQYDQQSSQENAAFLNHNNNNYYNNDPSTTTTNLMDEPPADDAVMQNDFTMPPPIVNIKVPDAGSQQQDSLAYNNNQQADSLMNHHAIINEDNEDEMLDNPSLSTMDDEEEDDNELYDDDEEDDMMATNDEEGYLFNVPDHNESMEDEELIVDPSTGMPAFRNKNDNDFNVMNQPNIPQSPQSPPPPPPPADQKSLPATDASISTTPLHQRSFFGDWRLLLAAFALLAVWKLVTGKPRFMGASTRVTQTCMIFKRLLLLLITFAAFHCRDGWSSSRTT